MLRLNTVANIIDNESKLIEIPKDTARMYTQTHLESLDKLATKCCQSFVINLRRIG